MTQINRNLRAVILLFPLLILSCSGWGSFSTGYRHITRFTAEDTLSSYAIDLYARLPAGYSDKMVQLILDITSPEGNIYRDTLSLPVTKSNIPNISAKSGRWSDMYWKYREGVKFAKSGNWTFALSTGEEYGNNSGTGEMGVMIRKM
jgi:hypothetical protein